MTLCSIFVPMWLSAASFEDSCRFHTLSGGCCCCQAILERDLGIFSEVRIDYLEGEDGNSVYAVKSQMMDVFHVSTALRRANSRYFLADF